eukprot:364820-Chlamydomonas_euryale.AAC.2
MGQHARMPPRNMRRYAARVVAAARRAGPHADAAQTRQARQAGMPRVAEDPPCVDPVVRAPAINVEVR